MKWNFHRLLRIHNGVSKIPSSVTVQRLFLHPRFSQRARKQPLSCVLSRRRLKTTSGEGGRRDTQKTMRYGFLSPQEGGESPLQPPPTHPPLFLPFFPGLGRKIEILFPLLSAPSYDHRLRCFGLWNPEKSYFNDALLAAFWLVSKII